MASCAAYTASLASQYQWQSHLCCVAPVCCITCASSISSVQFLRIIRDAVEDDVKAHYALKVFSLVESYASPAEYAKTTASVLAAAGAAAPRSLAGRVATTLALCGEADVQADTARVFLGLLRAPETLSEAQLLVRATVCIPVLHPFVCVYAHFRACRARLRSRRLRKRSCGCGARCTCTCCCCLYTNILRLLRIRGRSRRRSCQYALPLAVVSAKPGRACMAWGACTPLQSTVPIAAVSMHCQACTPNRKFIDATAALAMTPCRPLVELALGARREAGTGVMRPSSTCQSRGGESRSAIAFAALDVPLACGVAGDTLVSDADLPNCTLFEAFLLSVYRAGAPFHNQS